MKNRYCIALICLIFSVFSLYAEEVGEVVYYQGGVEVTRDGDILEDAVDFGFPVENFDTYSCGKNGLIEIEVFPESGIDGTVTVRPNSTFYFDLSPAKKQQRGGIELLAGSVALSVKKLVGNSSLEVRTDSATMGVRGTDFEVSTSVQGDVLVTCSTGKVECSDGSGKTLFALPGQVVEKQAGDIFRNIPVAVSNLSEYRTNWHADKIEAFKSNALNAIKYYALRYQEYREKFSDAYRLLLDQREVVEKWIEEDKQGVTGSTIEVMREKKNLIGPLMRLRGVLFIFERLYFRVQELADYHGEGYGRGMISAGFSTGDFFNMVKDDKSILAARMADIRYVMKLYAERNNGSLPAGGLSDSLDGSIFEDDEDFFDDDDDFF